MFTTNSRDIAGVHKNNFPLNFQLGGNYNKTDNNVSLKNDNDKNMDDSTVLIRNNKDISSDYENIINEYKDTPNYNITIVI